MVFSAHQGRGLCLAALANPHADHSQDGKEQGERTRFRGGSGNGGGSGSATVTLSAESTAVALVYFALGGFGIPAENRAELLDLIAADASLPPLVQTVTQQIGTNPLALVLPVPTSREAISTAGRISSSDHCPSTPKPFVSNPVRGSRTVIGASAIGT